MLAQTQPKVQKKYKTQNVQKPRARPGTNPRSRAGCATCKAKHIKCDEAKPECLNCTRKGIKCGGFWRDFKWSFKHQPRTEARTVEGLEDGTQNHESQDDISSVTLSKEAPVTKKRRTANTERHNFLREAFTEAVALWESTSSPNHQVDGRINGGMLPMFNELPWAAPTPDVSDTFSSSVPSVSNSPIHDMLSLTQYETVPTLAFPGDEDSATPILSRASISDMPSILVTNWFEHVCPVWSGFDSPTNLNRILAANLWQDSPSVFGALQSMSAGFLASRLPHMRHSAIQYMKNARAAIQTEVQMVRGRGVENSDGVPTGLLFSLFCMGTTLCWVDAGQLGLPFFREAKMLLKSLNRRSLSFSDGESNIIEFFNKSLTYYELLLAAVNDADVTGEDDAMAREQRDGSAEREEDAKSIDTELHPWTGLSPRAARLFARTMRLCRRHRRQMRTSALLGKPLSDQDMIQAKILEEQILDLDFKSEHLQVNDTGDQKTPSTHLQKAAEAYQLASLLQLYQAFPELVSIRLPLKSLFTTSGNVPWEDWIIPLSLRLVNVLSHIPPNSGSRVIQPLLYISASSGLRYDHKTMMEMFDTSEFLSGDLAGPSSISDMTPGLPGDNGAFGGLMDWISNNNNSTSTNTMRTSPPAPEAISRMSIDISNARHFIMARLGMLEYSLPPKPVIVARELVKAVWEAYDNEQPDCTKVHWMDVMEARNLRSMFG